MLRLQSVLLYLHIVGAIFWFGSGLFLQLVLVPALKGWQFEAQKPLLLAISGRYGKVVGPLGGLTVLFGILRGLAAGVLGNLGGPYGVTFLASIVGAGFVIVVGARFIGPPPRRWPRQRRGRVSLSWPAGSRVTAGSRLAACW